MNKISRRCDPRGKATSLFTNEKPLLKAFKSVSYRLDSEQNFCFLLMSVCSYCFERVDYLKKTTSSKVPSCDLKHLFLRLLELGFDQFVRVGSVKKIAKPVLPFSIHSIGTESQELKELQGLLKTELTSSEKA